MELVLLLLFLSLPFRCFFPSNLYRPAPPRSRNRTVLRRINFYKEELYNRGKAEGERKRREGWTIWRSRIHQHFHRSREREDSPKKGREESEEGVRKRSFFQIRVAPFVKIFPDRKCLGAEKWLELVRMADPRPGTMPLPPPTRKLVVQRSARLQNIAASLAKPGDVYARGEGEEEGRGKFSVLPELLSRKSFLSHFSPPTSPRFFAPPSRFRGFRRLRETCSIPGREYDTTGIRDPARKKSTGMLFALGFLSPVFPSLSLCLPSSSEKNGGCWLVSSSPSFFLFRMRAVDARNSRKPRCRKCSCATTGAKLSSTLVSFRLPRRASASLDGFIVRTGVKARRLKSGSGISPLLSISLSLSLSQLFVEVTGGFRSIQGGAG